MPLCANCQSAIEPEARFCPECGTPVVKAPKRLGPGVEVVVQGLGRAVLGHEIGEGGMGIVYRGWLYYDPHGPQGATPPHPVAVKVLNPLLRGHDRARRLFAREAEALKRLAHPNIVHFFALAEDDAQTAIVMELVQGEPLSTVLQRAVAVRPSPRTPAVPFLLSWHYFAQLLGALAAVHEIGVLHRDVKPANLIARADGVLKLTDFGIARLPSNEAAQTGGLAAGTGAYMSPEAVRGEAQDPRSDLYAAAIVLYELPSPRWSRAPPRCSMSSSHGRSPRTPRSASGPRSSSGRRSGPVSSSPWAPGGSSNRSSPSSPRPFPASTCRPFPPPSPIKRHAPRSSERTWLPRFSIPGPSPDEPPLTASEGACETPVSQRPSGRRETLYFRPRERPPDEVIRPC
jgi:serine/threonine protein kinase